jgi:hypothetical protein
MHLACVLKISMKSFSRSVLLAAVISSSDTVVSVEPSISSLSCGMRCACSKVGTHRFLSLNFFARSRHHREILMRIFSSSDLGPHRAAMVAQDLALQR